MGSTRKADDVLEVPAAERAFYQAEFAGATIVVSLADPDDATTESLRRAASALETGGARLVVVLGAGPERSAPLATDLAAVLRSPPLVLHDPGGAPDADWMADLWLAVTDHSAVVVTEPSGLEAEIGATLAASLRALKLVVTDDAGGWGQPPRSFADMATHADALEQQLGQRRDGQVVAAIRGALAGGVTSVNLCRPADVDRELFTFDGTGTLFTGGGYVTLDRLRVDDLPAVERLVAQGTSDGVLRPRSRHEIARQTTTGIGARVVGSGHLAGIVSLETEAYADAAVGEVVCLYTVSRFSGAGAGGLLVDGLVERAEALGLRGVFAVTVSDAAADFFARKEFVEVDHDRVPAAKWDDYDPARRSQARAFWRGF